MPKWIDPKISLGNLITVATMLLAAIVAYVQLSDQVKASAVDISALKRTDQEIISRVDAMREAGSSRQETVVHRLARIEAILERMERGQNAPR